MAEESAIRVEGLWKRYGLKWPESLQRLGRRLGVRSHPEGNSSDWALQDVTFEVRKGETLGIVGRNGAGKSTLLKVLAGVSVPTEGRVEVFGRVFPMIELNAGLNMDLTGRENVQFLGAVMGLSRPELEVAMPDIEDFTELEDWFDRPVRTYSSGMLARLGFGVAVNVESDVILIDETFAVGDLKFRNKSLAKVKEMRESGATILLVSHSLDTLQFVAKHGILLENGRIIARGTSLETINAYEKLVFRSEQSRLQHRARNRISSNEVVVHGARIYGEDDGTLTEVSAGEPFGVEIDLLLNRELERPLLSLGIVNTSGILCMWNVSEEDGFSATTVRDRCLVKVWYPGNHLTAGAYEVHFAIRDATSFETLERIAGLVSFAVIGTRRARGVVAGVCAWEILRSEE